ALAKVLEVPSAHKSLIPGPNLPVTEFLKLPFPKKSSALVFSKPEDWFSNDAPNVTVTSLLTRPIPPREFLNSLTQRVGQAWFDGHTSIRDPRYNEGRDRFPLWTLTLWKELLRVVEDQKMWKRSRDWIQTELEKPDLESGDLDALTTANSLLDTLGWDTKIHGSWTTFNLSIILSYSWLSDDHIDMMMADLSARLAADPELAADVMIAPLAFAVAIMNGAANKTYTRQDSTLLARYEEHIKKNGLMHLYFPLHIHNNHWIAGLIDFELGLIGTGDSHIWMNSLPRKFIEALKRWLKKQFGRDFVYQGDTLEHGDQKDGTSCGIICRNTIAVNVFGETLWDQKHAAGARAACFVRLVRSEAIRKMVTVAIGDHNFPDLAAFGLGAPAPTRQNRPTLADLLNPSETARASDAPTKGDDVDMPDVSPPTEQPLYLGDHGDVESDVELDYVEEQDDSSMDVDPPPKPTGILRFFPGAKVKTYPRPSAAGKGKNKRGRDADSDLDESADVDPKKLAKKPKKANGTGISKSALSAQKTRDALKSGELTVQTADLTRYSTWQNTLRTGKHKDPDVKFHPTNVRQAQHSLCGKWVTMGEAYEAGRWNQHVKTACPVLHPSKKAWKGDGLKGVPTLAALGFTASGKSSAEKPTRPTQPCPGITTSICPRLPTYFIRTGAAGGGSRSTTIIARELFGKLFRRLKDKDKETVADTQRHERQWANDHDKQRVFSTSCKKTVLAVGVHGMRVLPCSECSAVLRNPRFKQAIRLPVPDNENYLYVNQQYRNQALGHIYARTIGLKEIIETADAKNTPCIKFAQGTLQGKYDDFKVFGGLVEAMVQKADRIERGVGMQNFKYPPAWDEMTHIVNIHSPRAAKALREHLPIRTHRSFRAKEAREPRFPMVLGERNFALVQEYLAAIKYDGPVGLSCDDTKLFPALRVYHDKEKKADYLVGAVGGPIQVLDPEHMTKVLADANTVKATKVRVWCLTVPLPGITPLVVAAMPIRDDMSADELLIPLETILYGLTERNICVISYACDGTETERSLQRKLVERAKKVIEYKVTSPIPSAPDLELKIATFNGYPVVMLQDSKHALKTFRNNLFSGARMLTFGNFTAIFRRIHAMAMSADSPMYRRDVERLDRQDDSAACRLFCAAVLEYLSENHPDHIGEIVYLFVFGELVDAYQSRDISHRERIKLALRARYFLDAWAKYLDAAGYKQSQYFLSREAVDIARYLIEGIISLVLIHRDHVPGTTPLLPWYHSSEPCEHTFGDSRDIVKDFAFLDFIFFVPKLCITMREAVLSGKASNSKAAAQGYTHTYFDTVGADLAKLATYPSNEDIEQASEEAAAECESLIALLGITPGQLHQDAPAPLPSIGAWFTDADSDSPEDEEFDDVDLQVTSEAEELQAVIDNEERWDSPLRSARQDREIMSLTCASIAVAVDEHMRVQQFQEPNDELMEEILGDEYVTIQETLASVATTRALPSVQIPSEVSKPFGRGANADFANLDFKALINQRKQHQTRQAATCARIKQADPSGDSPVASEESLRRQILRKFHEILKEDQSRAVGTGVVRKARWETAPKTTAGNAANAAAAASTLANKAGTQRKKLFKDAKLP
ncbi:hypothetical protein B0H11DRAFT_2406543, partial [Mycena galericulata]